MKALRIISDSEGVSQEALEYYVNLLKHPLSQCHVDALSALFGWNTPADLVAQ
jgi:beta-glucosidase/6-phospho-beta-glucosidase/beta-galactosidase